MFQFKSDKNNPKDLRKKMEPEAVTIKLGRNHALLEYKDLDEMSFLNFLNFRVPTRTTDSIVQLDKDYQVVQDLLQCVGGQNRCRHHLPGDPHTVGLD